MGRRFDCPVEGHTSAYVVLPDEWLGKHALRRDDALKAISNLENKTVELSNAIMAVCLADEWDGIPGLEGNDPDGWRVEETPLVLLNWLAQVVIADFNASFIVPKNSSEPLPIASQVTAKKRTRK